MSRARLRKHNRPDGYRIQRLAKTIPNFTDSKSDAYSIGSGSGKKKGGIILYSLWRCDLSEIASLRDQIARLSLTELLSGGNYPLKYLA